MAYLLKENVCGTDAEYRTELEITEKSGIITFRFKAEHSALFCARRGYNKEHYLGDACEVFIGNSIDRKTYYEIEVSPRNDLFLAKITYNGEDESGAPDLTVNFVPEEKCFVKSSVTEIKGGYVAEISFEKNKIITGDGEIFFNAYRLETDGGEPEKYLFSLNPTLCGKFHVPGKFVRLKDYIRTE